MNTGRRSGKQEGAKASGARPEARPACDSAAQAEPGERIEEPERADAERVAAGIPVIGLGGSAGSLESFKAFFAAMPVDSGAAFVVIQHLAPAHDSMLSELLTQYTRMPVVEARDAMPLAANTVSVIPPGRYLAISRGVLHLTEPVLQHGMRMSIDFFFRSLANDRRERAVCILFSGSGSDGTLGVRAIRGEGGLTIVQDPATAPFADMPRSAVATGQVDFVLAPEAMPKAVVAYLEQPYVRSAPSASALDALAGSGSFSAILNLVRTRTGCDFRCYKKGTILRRIERRMGLHRIDDLAAYAAFLQQQADEAGQLFKDLLINVTAFFRDSDAFEELRQQVIVPLVRAKQPDEPLRVWVPGCASGEEAYSLAMLLLEEAAASQKHGVVQVFATDVDEEALAFARAGLYPESIATDVGADRLARFFIGKERGYQIGDLVRNAVIFAAQDLISDPPFSKMDLVSCRNLLIYLDPDTQARLVPLFNFALNPGGCLFLGKSEGVGNQHDLFATVSKRARIYRRLTSPRPLAVESPLLPGRKRTLPPAGLAGGKPPASSYGDMLRQALLRHFDVAVVLADSKGQVLQFHGQTVKYFNMPTSEPNLNLLDMAKEGLALKLRAAMHRAAGEGHTVVLEDVPLTRDAGSALARVTVMPVTRRSGLVLNRAEPADGREEGEPLLAVFFEDVAQPAPGGAGAPVVVSTSETTVKQLEDELRATQQDLQATIEELQSSIEELRVANEEVISTNEELQSSNEELETSKEELQSVNEELTTVNSQLQEKVERLDTANSDMANFLQATEIATLFLDDALRVRLFTPATGRIIKLIPSDVGRPIGDLSLNFTAYDLTADARAVIQTSSVIEREVLHADGACYLVRVMPYRTPQGRADGVAVTFGDVTRLRRAERQTRLLAIVLKDSNDAVVLFDLEGRIQAWNRGAQILYGWTEAEALELCIGDLAPADKTSELSALMRRLLAGEAVTSFETQGRTKDGRSLDVWLTATVVVEEAGCVAAFAITGRDITARKQAEAALVRLNEKLCASNAELTHFNQAMMARELRMIELKKQVNELCHRAGQPPPYVLKSEQEADGAGTGDGAGKRH